MQIFKIIGNLLLAFTVVTALFFLVTLIPIEGNIQIKTVISGSMEPAIKTGSVVVIKPKKEYSAGEVITFISGSGSLTTHRIIAREEKEGVVFFRTKGDANDVSDGREISESEVVGRVVFSIPYLGYVTNFSQTPNARPVILIFIFILLMIAMVAPSKKKKINKENE